MGDGISVSGGTGGVTAQYESMLAAAARLDHAGTQLDDVVDVLGSGLLRWQLETAISADPTTARPLLDTLAGLRWIFGPKPAAGELHGVATQLRFAVAAYQHQDHGILAHVGTFLGGIGSLLTATGDALWTFYRSASVTKAGNTFLTDDPAVVDTLANDTVFGFAGVIDATLVPDGRPVLRDLGADARPAVESPPRGAADLMTALGVRNQGMPGEISVSFVAGADGRRRAIVDVPGTKSWSLGKSPDVTSFVTDARAIEGESTAYERGVLDAMTAAGVDSSDQVMIVGHSEGGMVAVNAARDAVASGRFSVTHVVTAGSPLGDIAASLPKSVQLLALEDEHDIVPHTDGRANPDEPTETTVTGGPDWNNALDNHSIEQSYVPLAHAVDGSDDRSIRAFLHSADGFLDDTTMTTHAYEITRSYH
jgi:hypothetical protein